MKTVTDATVAWVAPWKNFISNKRQISPVAPGHASVRDLWSILFPAYLTRDLLGPVQWSCSKSTFSYISKKRNTLSQIGCVCIRISCGSICIFSPSFHGWYFFHLKNSLERKYSFFKQTGMLCTTGTTTATTLLYVSKLQYEVFFCRTTSDTST